jgi:uncharacterized membrane protein YhaH (DUF805 family)
MEWYLMVWKKFAVFSGRSRRKEFFTFALFHFLIMILLCVLGVLLKDNVGGKIFMVLLWIYILAACIPCLSLGVRRLHDQGKSGWWWLLGFVPILNLVLIVFWFLNSDPGANKYGPNPKSA